MNLRTPQANPTSDRHKTVGALGGGCRGTVLPAHFRGYIRRGELKSSMDGIARGDMWRKTSRSKYATYRRNHSAVDTLSNPQTQTHNGPN